MVALKYIGLFCLLVGFSWAEEKTVCTEIPKLDNILGGGRYVDTRLCFTPNCPASVKGRKRSIIVHTNNICATFSDGSEETFQVLEHINDFVCYKRNTYPDYNVVKLFRCNKLPTV